LCRSGDWRCGGGFLCRSGDWRCGGGFLCCSGWPLKVHHRGRCGSRCQKALIEELSRRTEIPQGTRTRICPGRGRLPSQGGDAATQAQATRDALPRQVHLHGAVGGCARRARTSPGHWCTGGDADSGTPCGPRSRHLLGADHDLARSPPRPASCREGSKASECKECQATQVAELGHEKASGTVQMWRLSRESTVPHELAKSQYCPSRP
jgi:hypothetical protein